MVNLGKNKEVKPIAIMGNSHYIRGIELKSGKHGGDIIVFRYPYPIIRHRTGIRYNIAHELSGKPAVPDI